MRLPLLKMVDFLTGGEERRSGNHRSTDIEIIFRSAVGWTADRDFWKFKIRFLRIQKRFTISFMFWR